MIVIQPSYFGPISQFAVMAKHDSVTLEVCDNYQKQTYRNRCYIYGANGKLMLNIPVVHNKNRARQKTKDVKVERYFDWKQQHYKSIKTAYQTSPFFEFYEDDFEVFYNTNFTHLQEVNLASLELINDLLGLEVPLQKTTEYQPTLDKDYRYLSQAKTAHPFSFEPYTQQFDDKFGFLPNLSILDLLFMEGPNALTYIETQVKQTF